MRRRLAVGFSLSLFSRGCGLHTAALRKKGELRKGGTRRARDKVRKGTKMETVLVTQSNFARVPSSVEIHLPPPRLIRSSKERERKKKKKKQEREKKKGIHPCRIPVKPSERLLLWKEQDAGLFYLFYSSNTDPPQP